MSASSWSIQTYVKGYTKILKSTLSTQLAKLSRALWKPSGLGYKNERPAEDTWFP